MPVLPTDIPGIGEPIEEPVLREQHRTFHEPAVSVPELEYKSWLNPKPYISKFFYYSYQAPVETAHKFFESIRAKNRQRYFHKKYRRVPEIWECEVDDALCVFEAECQFKRDRKVDEGIIRILEGRRDACMNREGAGAIEKCKSLIELVKQVEDAWQIKYGDIGYNINAKKVLNKQKNRFIEDRYLARMKHKELEPEVD